MRGAVPAKSGKQSEPASERASAIGKRRARKIVSVFVVCESERVWGTARGATVACSASEAGSYLRLIDFVYHSTLGLRVIKKKKKSGSSDLAQYCQLCGKQAKVTLESDLTHTIVNLSIS